jgi:DNA-binding transcriptional ArsR family regulator
VKGWSRVDGPSSPYRQWGMAWRLHFTPDDLIRTRVATPAGPLAETMFGLAMLRCTRQTPIGFEPWRRRSLARVSAPMRPLSTLVPRGSTGVDLWTLTGAAVTIDDAVAALVKVPRDDLAAEMEAFDWKRRLPAAAWSVVVEDGEGRARLAAAMHESFRALLGPYWQRVDSHLGAERSWLGQIMMTGGVEALLATLYPPRIRWRRPVLEIFAPIDCDIHLAGRGLWLVPSVFVGECPLILTDLRDPAATPRLVFPVGVEVAGGTLLEAGPAGSLALGALVGHTRAAALRAIGDGCTTTELARWIGVSAAAASQHASVLRAAGLIVTRRRGGTVRHALTPLGASLIAST